MTMDPACLVVGVCRAWLVGWVGCLLVGWVCCLLVSIVVVVVVVGFVFPSPGCRRCPVLSSSLCLAVPSILLRRCRLLLLLLIARTHDLHDIHTVRHGRVQGKVLIDRKYVFLQRTGGTTFGQGVNIVTSFVGRSDGRFDAAIGQESHDNDIANATVAQFRIELRRRKGAQTVFGNDPVPFDGGHFVNQLTAPFAVRQGAGLGETGNDSVRHVRELALARLQTERTMNNLTASIAAKGH
mmetsp:Transcript_22688/g.53549  ORF Transcript_22688/g.53549 Transcript_22688/m.53549 type:complete len:239 (+) Transcript_22688:119-835(+)